jgi:hypothetical protein
LKRVFCFKKFEKINLQKFAKNSGNKERDLKKLRASETNLVQISESRFRFFSDQFLMALF